MKRTLAIMAALCAIATGCKNTAPKAEKAQPSTQSTPSEAPLKTDPCDISVCGVKFTKALNQANAEFKKADDSLRITARENTDIFRDPGNGSVIESSPIIFKEVDNTKPFTFTARLRPDFTPEGTYSAGALFVFESLTHWQKFAFEQDESGLHRVVSVRTIGTSDDNNHQALSGKDAYYRISSDGKAIGFYYSEDGKQWRMARLYKNDYPKTVLLGISAQSPKTTSHSCLFSEVQFVEKSVGNFRDGKL